VIKGPSAFSGSKVFFSEMKVRCYIPGQLNVKAPHRTPEGLFSLVLEFLPVFVVLVFILSLFQDQCK